MNDLKIKCPLCGNEFTTENFGDTVVCTSCKQQFSKMQGVKYYKTFYKVKTEEKKVAVGKIYAEVDALINEAEFYLKEEDFENANKVIEKAFLLTNSDYRVYLCAVMLKTKNFTDCKDKTHLPYFKKAIELANANEQERIKKIYAPFYKKSRVKEDEIEEYSIQEADSMKSRIEEILKDGIPLHFKREKQLKAIKILLPAFSVLTVAMLVISLILNSMPLIIASVTTLAVSIILLTVFSNLNAITSQYNATLDFYDAFKSFDLSVNSQTRILKKLEIIAVCYNNKEGDNSMSLNLQKLVNECISSNSNAVITYINNDKVLSKYVSE